MSKPFRVDTVRARADQLSFAVAGTAANQHDRALHQFVGGTDRRGVALYSRRRSGVIHASFFQPLLDDMRALAAAGAAQVTVWVTGARFQPRLSTAGAQVTPTSLWPSASAASGP